MYQFVGLLGTRLGDHDVTRYYKHKNPVVTGAKSLEEFVRSNAHLGRDFLEQVIMLTADDVLLHKQPMANANIEANIVPPSIVPTGDDEFLASILDKHAWAPGAVPVLQSDWAWSVMDDAVFSFVLNETTLGAIGLALNMIKRIDRHRNCTLKKIIMSPTVVDQFALLCSYQFLLASGGSAYAGTAVADRGTIKGARLMLSTGIQTRIMLSRQIEGCQMWFEIHVFSVNNPRVQEMQGMIEALQNKIDADNKLYNGDGYDYDKPDGIEQVIDFVARHQYSRDAQHDSFRNMYFFVPEVEKRDLNGLKAIKQNNVLHGIELRDIEKRRIDDYIRLHMMKKQQGQIVPSLLAYRK